MPRNSNEKRLSIKIAELINQKNFVKYYGGYNQPRVLNVICYIIVKQKNNNIEQNLTFELNYDMVMIKCDKIWIYCKISDIISIYMYCYEWVKAYC